MTALERRSALARSEVWTTASADGGLARHPPVSLRERRPLHIVQISAFATTIDAAARVVSATLGVDIPPPNRLARSGACEVRTIGPGVWQCVSSATEAGATRVPAAGEWRRMLQGVGTVVDLSHARTALQIAGPEAPHVLAKYCPLDLEASRFPAGTATSTRFGHLGMTLARLDDAPTFEILVFRGYAEHVAEQLVAGAREYGV